MRPPVNDRSASNQSVEWPRLGKLRCAMPTNELWCVRMLVPCFRPSCKQCRGRTGPSRPTPVNALVRLQCLLWTLLLAGCMCQSLCLFSVVFFFDVVVRSPHFMFYVLGFQRHFLWRFIEMMVFNFIFYCSRNF